MKAALFAGLAAAAMIASPAMAQYRIACPQGAYPAAQVYSPRAESATDAARDTAYRDYVRDNRELGYWQELKVGWPRVDYDLIYGPGAFHQNYELPPLPK